MIIKCENCSTSFKLPDDKIKPEGTKVRCSKCKSVFTVYPPQKEVSEAIPEFEEKTRIGFIPSPFGEEKDDEGPVTIKRHQQEIGSSVEMLGHGIPLSSPEIKQVEEPSKDLNEIMSAISEGLKQSSNEGLQENASEDISAQSAPSDNSTNIPPQQSVSNELDSLLENLSDIQPEVKEEKKADVPEELPDLSALLSAVPAQSAVPQVEEKKIDIPDLNSLLSPSNATQSQQVEQATPATKQPEASPAAQKLEDKLSLDIDKVFDSLFSEQPAKTESKQDNIPNGQQPRKTMLYMEAVPVAPQNPPQPAPKEPSPFETMELGGLSAIPSSQSPAQVSAQPQIQDSLLSDDLSMFLSPQAGNTGSNAPPTPTLNLSDDPLSELSIPSVANTGQAGGIAKEPPAPSNSDFQLSFGDLGSISDSVSSDSPKMDDNQRFSPNANRSDDLLSQMDSIDSVPMPVPVQAPVAPPPKMNKIDLENRGLEDVSIPTVEEARVEKRQQQAASIKPPTVALKTNEKSLKSEILRWIFTLSLLGFVVFAVLTPSITFPGIREDIFKILKGPLTESIIEVESLYYKNINEGETLLIFMGNIHLNKPVPPEEIMIRFRMTDLAGTEIIQVEYPVTYTEDFDSLRKISTVDDIKRFLKENRLKMITQKTNRFVAPLILKNIDLSKIDIRVEIITPSR